MRARKIFLGLIGGLMAAALLTGGYWAGESRIGQPRTVIHVVSIKWNPNVSDAEKKKVLDGVKDMAARIPGIKNVWIESDRIEPRDFSTAFAIEFQSRAAAEGYAENTIHKIWTEHYLPLRATSISVEVTNR
jgi:Stress responsive A/B Barrel Domain